MTDKTFNAVFTSLASYYRLDEKPDKNARIEYFKSVKFVDDSDARSLYSDIVNNYTFFPKIPDIKAVAEKYHQAPKVYKNDEFCYVCCDIGLIHYSKKGLEPFPDIEYDFVAFCPYCDAGKNYRSPKTPSIDQIFLPEQIKEIEKRNFERFGNVSKEKVEVAKHKVQYFLRAI